MVTGAKKGAESSVIGVKRKYNMADLAAEWQPTCPLKPGQASYNVMPLAGFRVNVNFNKQSIWVYGGTLGKRNFSFFKHDGPAGACNAAMIDIMNNALCPPLPSEVVLKTTVSPGVLHESHCYGDRGVAMFKDQYHVYFLSRETDHVLAKGTIVGGFGGGCFVQQRVGNSGSGHLVLPFSLLEGDLSYIQLERDGEDEGKPKEVGILRSFVEPLMAKDPAQL